MSPLLEWFVLVDLVLLGAVLIGIIIHFASGMNK